MKWSWAVLSIPIDPSTVKKNIMFSGIISTIGKIAVLHSLDGGDREIGIDCAWPAADIGTGDSISVSGICLSVTRITARGDGCRFFVTASLETLSRTTLADRACGDSINLEQALRLGDRLDGHMVFGHIDAPAIAEACRAEGRGLSLSCRVPKNLLPLIVPRGSIALDGVALTVTAIDTPSPSDCLFSVHIIEWTRHHTTLGALEIGQKMNFEADMIARVVTHATKKYT